MSLASPDVSGLPADVYLTWATVAQLRSACSTHLGENGIRFTETHSLYGSGGGGGGAVLFK
ncbi:MAG: hypothetical protein H6716_05150 [Polyangiaceae bacterium]|nr:hypothetical protein [Polyangiaceae bacterium]